MIHKRGYIWGPDDGEWRSKVRRTDPGVECLTLPSLRQQSTSPTQADILDQPDAGRHSGQAAPGPVSLLPTRLTGANDSDSCSRSSSCRRSSPSSPSCLPGEGVVTAPLRTAVRPEAKHPPALGSAVLQCIRFLVDRKCRGTGQCVATAQDFSETLSRGQHTTTSAVVYQGLEKLRHGGEIWLVHTSSNGDVLATELVQRGATPLRVTIRDGFRLAHRQLFGGESVMVQGPNRMWIRAYVTRVVAASDVNEDSSNCSSHGGGSCGGQSDGGVMRWPQCATDDSGGVDLPDFSGDGDRRWQVGSQVFLAFKDSSGAVRDWPGTVRVACHGILLSSV
jgi:hypothetical protein